MASCRKQALIEAPVESVWELLTDPVRGPEWDPDLLEVMGAPVEIRAGSTFETTGRGPLGLKATSAFKVEELDDLHEIKMRCQKSGYYVHWLLTPAQGNTFTELELGVQPLPGIQGRAMGAVFTGGFLRRTAENTLEALERAIGSGALFGRPGSRNPPN
ncbi:MAG TPA: SRPBCC family protein [Solirubrobacterales bacterium]|nr:SRPBCC family protein [Solirubrobacterales bacterium]